MTHVTCQKNNFAANHIGDDEANTTKSVASGAEESYDRQTETGQTETVSFKHSHSTCIMTF